MILFCEECGKKNLLSDCSATKLQDGFECNHCGYRTPLSSILHHLEQNERVITCDCPMDEIEWFPKTISFGKTDKDRVHFQDLVFFQKRKKTMFNLICHVEKDLANDLTVEKLEDSTFRVTLSRDPGNNGIIFHQNYHGEALSFYDEHSSFSCKIPVYFSRQDQTLRGLPPSIELSNLYSGLIHHDYLIAENCGTENLVIHLKPDPADFTIAARFVIENSLGIKIAPKEIIQIPYSLWPEEYITEDWQFSQTIWVKAQNTKEEIKKSVKLFGKLSAPIN